MFATQIIVISGEEITHSQIQNLLVLPRQGESIVLPDLSETDEFLVIEISHHILGGRKVDMGDPEADVDTATIPTAEQLVVIHVTKDDFMGAEFEESVVE